MKQFLANQTLPNNLSLSAQWRFKNKAKNYSLVDGKVVSKLDGRIYLEDDEKKAVLDQEYSSVMGGRDKLWWHCKKKYENLSQVECLNYLKGNTVNQLHTPAKKQKVFRRIVSGAPNDRWECDWIQLPKYNRYQYLFMLIDHNSKKGWAWKMVSRSHKPIVAKIKPLFLEHKPKVLQCDNEFRSKEFLDMCQLSGTKIINSSTYKPNSNGLVERWNKTFKSILYKLMTERNTNDWPNLVDQALEIYNKGYHSVIKGAPEEHFEKKISTKMVNTSRENPKFVVGNTVRKVIVRDPNKKFNKSFVPQWSEALYKVIRVFGGDIASYEIMNLETLEILQRKFYNHTLLLVK